MMKKTATARRQSQGTLQPFSFGLRTAVPAVISGVTGVVRGASSRVRHREFVTDICSSHSATWHTQSFNLNPASAAFPWLRNVASAWEKYHYNMIEFEWVPNVAATTAGSIVAYFDYDAKDVPAHEKGVALAHRSSVNFQFCQPAVLRGDPNLLAGQRYICADFPALSGGDIHLYDVAHFHLGWTDADITQGATLGSLFLTYDIDLIEPAAISTLSPGSYQGGTRIGAQSGTSTWVFNPLTAGTISGSPSTGASSPDTPTMISTAIRNAAGALGLPDPRNALKPGLLRFIEPFDGWLSCSIFGKCSDTMGTIPVPALSVNTDWTTALFGETLVNAAICDFLQEPTTLLVPTTGSTDATLGMGNPHPQEMVPWNSLAIPIKAEPGDTFGLYDWSLNTLSIGEWAMMAFAVTLTPLPSAMARSGLFHPGVSHPKSSVTHLRRIVEDLSLPNDPVSSGSKTKDAAGEAKSPPQVCTSAGPHLGSRAASATR